MGTINVYVVDIFGDMPIWFPFPFWMVDRFCFTWRRLFVVDHYRYGFREATQQVGVVVLVLFMLMVLVIDISRLFERN